MVTSKNKHKNNKITNVFRNVEQGNMSNAGMRIRFCPKNRIRSSVPQTKGDFKKSIVRIF